MTLLFTGMKPIISTMLPMFKWRKLYAWDQESSSVSQNFALVSYICGVKERVGYTKSNYRKFCEMQERRIH